MSIREIELNDSQWELLNTDDYEEIAIWGGWGGGKSFGALIKVLKHAHETPNSLWWLCRKTIDQAKSTIWEEFVEKIVPPEWIVSMNQNERVITIKSRLCKHGKDRYCHLCSEIRFKPLDDVSKIESANLSGIFIDQAEETTAEMIDKLQGRLRRVCHMKDGGDVRLIRKDGKVVDRVCSICGHIEENELSKQYMLTVGNPSAGWPVERYFNGATNQKRVSKYAESWEKIIKSSNPSIKDYRIKIINVDTREGQAYQPENYYDKQVASHGTDMVERMVHGSWKHFVGSAIKCLEPSKHFIESFVVPAHWQKWMAYDYGVTNPFAILVFAKDPDTNKVYIVDEAYAKGKYINEQVYCLKELHKKWFKPHEMVDLFYDYKISDIRGDGKSNLVIFNEETEKQGIYDKVNLIKGEKDEQAGLNIINMLFKNDALFVFRDTCPNVCRELPGIKYKERNLASNSKGNESEQLVDKNNHTFDSCKYGLNNYYIDETKAQVVDQKREAWERGELDWSDKDYEKYEDELAKEKNKEFLNQFEDLHPNEGMTRWEIN